MRAEGVMMALLRANATVLATVGASPQGIYFSRMAENAPFPALVLETVSGQLVTPINATAGMQLLATRIQVNALARTVLQCKQLLDYARIALEFQSGVINATLGGATVPVTVQGIWREAIGPDLKDDELGVYVQSHDYVVMHFET